MKRFILTIALLSSALVAGAQTSIEEVLRSVETNNKELQANRQMVTAQKDGFGGDGGARHAVNGGGLIPICMETKREWDLPVN